MSDADPEGMTRPQDGVPANLFEFEEVTADRYRAPAIGGPLLRHYGGHVLAQTLAVAQRTAPPGRLSHSCHAYFVRAGNPEVPIDFEVTRDADGRSFSARRVAALQAGRLILSLSASMHEAEAGAVQQAVMPDVPPPEALPEQDAVIEAAMPDLPAHRHPFWNRDLGMDFRSVEPFVTRDPPVRPARRHFWMKTKRPLSDDPALHQQMLAYMSDMYLMHTGLNPLAVSWADPLLQDASLDHAIWFHQRFRADDWLLYAMDSPFSGGARTLARGTVYTRDGRVAASVAQEGLIRLPAGHG